MKIAHLSDLHLGRRSAGDPNGAERLNSLRQAIAKLAPESPDAILIAGDTFDSLRIDQAVVTEAARALAKARDADGRPIPVVVIPGNHDPSDSTDLWEAFRSALGSGSSVYLVLVPQAVALCGGKLVVEAYPCETRYSPESPWVKRIATTNDAEGPNRVVLAHGTLLGGPVPEGETEAYPFTQGDAEGLGAEYVALGHFHGIYPKWDGGQELSRRVCYAGTHEPDQFNSDSGWAILVSLVKGRPAMLRRMRVGKRHWRLLEIQGPTDLARLETLRSEVEGDNDPSRFMIRVKVGGKTILSPGEAEKLQSTEAGLRALGAQVERQGDFQTWINVESLDLSTLSSGAVKESLLSLQSELAQAQDEAKREILKAAIRLGWTRLQQHAAS
jgi:DNA repair exonuclease SbcCD nuclease subunit